MKAITILIFICWTLICSAQNGIDVYECGAVNPPVTQAQVDANYSYYGACVQFDQPNTYLFDQTDNHLVVGGKGIDVAPGFTAHNFTSGGAMTLELCSDLKEVRAFDVLDLGAVEALKKFEVGIELPANIMQRVDAFINTGDTSGNQLNPYLSWHLQAKATFVHRSSQFQKVAHGFYFQDFERDTNYVNKNNWTWDTVPTTHPFRFRYAPEKLGVWDIKITVVIANTDTLTYCPFSINVTPNTSDDGFVKVAPNNRMLERNGELFFAVGQNLPWPINDATIQPVGVNAGFYGSEIVCSYPFVQYGEVMEEYKEKGTNFFRMILNSSTTEIEFEEVGNYTKRLHCGWEVDQIIEKAEELDLYIHFNMLLHDYFDNKNLFFGFSWDWGDSSVQLLPPASYDQSYGYRERFNLGNNESYKWLTDLGCKKYYKERVRYLLGRYGYSPHVAIFELLSESNNIGHLYEDYVIADTIYDSLGNFVGIDYKLEMESTFDLYTSDSQQPLRVAAWHDEMAKYVKNELGHDQHLLSVSYTGLPQPNDYSYGIPEVDVITWNQYNRSISKYHNLSEVVRLKHQQYNKPVLWSENDPLDEHACDGGLTYKKDAWKSAFTGVAGFNMWAAGLNNGEPQYWPYLKMVQDFVQNNDTINRLLMSNNWVRLYLNDAGNIGDANRKELIALEGIYLDGNGQLKKVITGVVSNLTYNYYSDRILPGPTEDIPFCYNDAPSNLDQWYKSNLTFGGLLYQQLPFTQYNYNWYDSEGNYLLSNYPIDGGIYDLIQHPLSCVTDICEQLTPELPFIAVDEYVFERKKDELNENPEQVHNDSQKLIDIFPNPTSGRFTIVCNDEEVTNYEVLNSMGQPISNNLVNKGWTNVDLTNHGSGIYVILAFDYSNKIKYTLRCVKF